MAAPHVAMKVVRPGRCCGRDVDSCRILKDNGRPDAAAVYEALAMPFAVLVGQIAHAYGK
jgi:hypothetical protein